MTLLVYGGALPDLGTQGALVTPLSVPNLLGLAAGHGGADAAVRSVARAAIIAVAAAGTVVVAVRRQWALTAIGTVLLCAVLALPWVMPWYLVWALPFIAVGRPRVLVPVAAIAACWLVVVGLPRLPGILHSLRLLPDAPADGPRQSPRIREAGAMTATVEREAGRVVGSGVVGAANTAITLSAFVLLTALGCGAPAASAARLLRRCRQQLSPQPALDVLRSPAGALGADALRGHPGGRGADERGRAGPMPGAADGRTWTLSARSCRA